MTLLQWKTLPLLKNIWEKFRKLACFVCETFINTYYYKKQILRNINSSNYITVNFVKKNWSRHLHFFIGSEVAKSHEWQATKVAREFVTTLFTNTCFFWVLQVRITAFNDDLHSSCWDSPLLLYRIPLTYCSRHHSRKTASKNTIGWIILSDVFLDEIADSICLTLLMYSRRQPIVILTILLLLWLNWPFVFSVLRFRNLLVLFSVFPFLGNLVAHGYDPTFLHTILFKKRWRRFAEREEKCQSKPGSEKLTHTR